MDGVISYIPCDVLVTFLKQVRDFGMNLFNKELVTPFNYGAFV